MLISVNKECMNFISQVGLTTGEYNAHELEFKFTLDYINLIKFAVFQNGEKIYKVKVENDKVVIPWEVLEDEGNLYIGVYAYEMEGNILKLRYSPKPIQTNISKGSFIENGTNTEPLTPTDKEEIFSELNNIDLKTKNITGGVEIEMTNTKGETTKSIVHNGKDGSDYVITEEDYQAIANVVEGQITIPTKTSQLQNDSNFVSNTDYATGTVGGVLKQSSERKFALDENGYPMVNTVTYADYGSLANGAFIGKGTLENVIAGKNLDGVYYGTCSTGATTQEKAVTCAGYRLQEGNVIYVKMTNGNTYNGVAKLNVNSTGAIDISKGVDTGSRYFWIAGELVCFVYDGTNYTMINKGTASTTYYGVTKLATSATSANTVTALTPNSLNLFSQTTISGYPVYSSSSTYEVGDRVRYSYGTYECITAITTAESWTEAHWKLLDPLQKQIDDNKTYSTTETVIGTYLGKPLYRKIIQITKDEYTALPTTTNSRKGLDVSSLNIAMVITGNISLNYLELGKLYNKTSCMHRVGTNNYDLGCHSVIDGVLNFFVGASILTALDGKANILLEYTKTTD